MPTPDAAAPLLIVRLFGPFEALLDGAPLPGLRRRKARWLLALLALRAGREVERTWLAGLLWPEAAEVTALKNLRSSLADLRQALGTAAARLRSPTSRTLRLDLTGADADVVAFDAALAAGDEASLEQAVALYRGALLEGCMEEWAFQERQVRERAYLEALETLAARALARGEIQAAERHLRRAVSADPLLESAQRALMQTLVAEGNYAAAIPAYRELRLRLHREISVAPDPETTALFQHFRAVARQRACGSAVPQEPTLAAAQASRFGTPAPVRRAVRGEGRASEAVAAAELPLFALQRALAGGRLVGRDPELSTLQRQIEAAAQGWGGTLLLAGEPGIGKTRLAAQASEYARQRSFRVLIGRCDEAGAAPYQPFGEALRDYLDSASPEQAEATLPPPVACELVRLAPRVVEKVQDVPQVAPAAGAAARQALVEAMGEFVTLLTTHQDPVLLFLDDLHRADEGSLAMLHALARRAKRLPLLIVGTYRDLPPDLQRPLEQTLAALNRERTAECLPLRRLPLAGVGEVVAALFNEASPPAAFIATLHRETEGNPFFLEEVLKHLVEEGAIFRDVASSAESDEAARRGGAGSVGWRIKPLEEFRVPPSVKVAIGRRLERLADESREALRLAAVIGQHFDFEVLQHASGLEEERQLAIVEECLEAHLVVEERDGAAHPQASTRRERYRFHHALIREVLYDEVSLRRRARLHERVGLALEAVCSKDLEEHLDELAHHFADARSGPAMEKGVDYCLRAGEKARTVYAHQEAIRHLTAALELLDGLPADEPHLRKRWEVVDHLWQVYRDCREHERARELLQEYLALAERADYPWGMAAAHFQMCSILGSLVAVGSLVAGVRDSESARRLRMEHWEQCLQIAEARGLMDWQAQARVNLAAGSVRSEKDWPRAEVLLRRTLQAPEEVPRDVLQFTYRELVLVCAWQGKWDEVAEAVRQSIHVGVPGIPAGCLGVMEEALNREGKQAQFIAFCEETKALYAQAGLPLARNQWYLETAAPSPEFRQPLFRDNFDAPELRSAWQWQDPIRASSYSLSERPGHLTLRAGWGVDLWPSNNLNAPRMLLEARGDFALETRMPGDWVQGDWAQEPRIPRTFGISGLLVWKDALNWIRFDKCGLGYAHRGDMHLTARVAGAAEIFGRGQLLGDHYHLRLERTGERFAALCSTDGVHWLTCGHVDLPVKDPLQVGVWAGAGQGHVVHFDHVQVLSRGGIWAGDVS